MPQPIAEDVRARVIAAVAAGVSTREAARRLGVSVSSAVKWTRRWRRSGSYAPSPVNPRSRSPLQAETEWLLELVREQPGITLATVQCELHNRGINVALSSVWRFYNRHGVRLHQHRPVTQ